MQYNLLTPDGIVLRTWELGEEYQEKLFAVFPNEFEKIEKGELLVHLGELPKNFIIENNTVVEIPEEIHESTGGMDTWEQ